MSSWLTYIIRWLFGGDPPTPAGIRVYRAAGPVAIVWASGTGAKLDEYQRLLEFFQGREITVVACETGEAWDGAEVARAARYARTLPGVTTLAGVGHSGGGGGILNAAGRDASLFTRLVILATGRDIETLPSCPALFCLGARDTKIDREKFLALVRRYPGRYILATHATADHFSIPRAAGPVVAEFSRRGTVETILSDPYWTVA